MNSGEVLRFNRLRRRAAALGMSVERIVISDATAERNDQRADDAGERKTESSPVDFEEGA